MTETKEAKAEERLYRALSVLQNAMDEVERILPGAGESAAIRRERAMGKAARARNIERGLMKE